MRAMLRVRPFRLRHDIRSNLPAAIQAILQNGILYRAFEEALVPNFMFPAIGESRPWSQHLGDTGTFTRPGLLTPLTTPITGSDASAATYSIEQYSMTMDQYGQSIDTNLLYSASAIASKFLQDAQTIAINGGQSVNLVCRNRLYSAYRGGNTFLAATATSATQVVNDASGFDKVLVNGVPTAVSVSNTLAVTVNGVANTVTGCNLATNTLTFGSSVTGTAGFAVVAGNAPTIVRPAARASGFQLTSTDLATFSLFRTAVQTLRQNHVPGPYTAHVDAVTEAELFADAEFQKIYTGRADLPQWRDLAIGRFGGIDWVRNTEAETVTGMGSGGTLTAHRPIVVGSNALINGPMEGFDSLQRELSGPTSHVESITVAPGLSVAYIIRPPQDRLAQVAAQTWSWIGDFAVPSDATHVSAAGGNATARYKRAVVVEHV